MKAYVAENTDRECGVVQTRYLQNAAYMRLKNLTVGYTLPKVLLNKIGIERLRISSPVIICVNFRVYTSITK